MWIFHIDYWFVPYIYYNTIPAAITVYLYQLMEYLSYQYMIKYFSISWIDYIPLYLGKKLSHCHSGFDSLSAKKCVWK